MFNCFLPFFRKRNSENEEISKPCQPNLQNMPKVVMEEVLKHLDNQSIFRLRKVCRVLRFTIDNIKPEVHLNSLSFQLPLTTESMTSYVKHMEKSVRRDYMALSPPRTGCELKWVHLGNFKCSEISMEEAEALLKNTKLILNVLIINLCFSIESESEYIEKKEADLKKFQESLKSLLENEGHFLKTMEIRMQVHHLSEAAELLKCIDPKSLKTISIKQRSWDAPEAVEMVCSELELLEQWKNAEELKIKGNYILTPVESFASFKTIILWINKIPIETLNELKELFIRSPNMRTIIIKFDEISCEMKDHMKPNSDQFGSCDEEFDVDALSGIRGLTRRTWTRLKNVPDSFGKFKVVLNLGFEKYITFTKA